MDITWGLKVTNDYYPFLRKHTVQRATSLEYLLFTGSLVPWANRCHKKIKLMEFYEMKISDRSLSVNSLSIRQRQTVKADFRKPIGLANGKLGGSLPLHSL